MRIVLAVAAALSGPAAMASSAHAVFHLVTVREVFPGTTANPNSAFVELQMYAPSQTLVSGHEIRSYANGSNPLGAFPIPSNVANGQTQRTILIGDTAVAGRDITYDQLGDTIRPFAAGAALCFDAVDCVSWGNFASPAFLPSPAGSPVLPAGGIPNGFSITRRITPNCPTLLEGADDTDSSAADFAQTAPSPRSNSTPPTETACSSGGGPGPDLVLSGKKKQKTGGKVVVKAQCTDQDCSLEAKGRSKLKAGAKSSATAAGQKSVRLKKDSADAAKGATVKLKLKHSKSGKRKVKRSVKGGGKAKAVVKVTATGAGGSTTEKFKAKLK